MSTPTLEPMEGDEITYQTGIFQHVGTVLKVHNDGSLKVETKDRCKQISVIQVKRHEVKTVRRAKD